MNKQKKNQIRKINLKASADIIEIKAILAALILTEQGSYPANILLELAQKKLIEVFYEIEKNRKMLKIIN